MNILQDTRQAFPEMELLNLEDNYKSMKLHKDIFRGFPPWRRTKASGLYSKGTRNRKLLNTAKVLCDEFSAMTFSEQVEITLDNEQYQEYITKTLDSTGFWRRFPEILSYAYALGGCALKIYADNSKPCIDFVQAENFLPTGWTGKDINECVFRTISYKHGSYYTLMERHSISENGTAIDNTAYRSSVKDSLGTKCSVSEMYPKLAEFISYGSSDVPMFCYFKPCVSNNIEADSPLGISVFANAVDTLEALDIAFDSFSREFILGKKRIIVPAECIRTIVDPVSGNMRRYFDADDEAFVALKTNDGEALKITDNTVDLRVEEHVSAINALLNILCFQTGLSAGTALKLIPHKDYSVTIGWQDNIIIDDNTLIDNNIKLVGAGLKSKLKAIMEVQKCDEETAQKELDRINKEQSLTGLEVDDFLNGNGGDTGDETGDNAAEPEPE